MALTLACGPRIDAGPIAAAVVTALPVWRDVPTGDADRQVVAIAVFAGSSFDTIGHEGTACRISLGAGGATERCGRDVVSATFACPAADLDACAATFAAGWLGARPGPPAAAHAWLTHGAFADAPRLAVEVLDAQLYASHAYGHPPAGRVGVVNQIGDADVAALAALRRVRTTTAAAGPSAARSAVQPTLAALPARIVRSRPLIAPLSARGARLRSLAASHDGAALAAGAPVAALSDADGAWLGLAAFAAALRRQGTAEVTASWGELTTPVAGLDLGGPRQSPRLVIVLRGDLVGAQARLDTTWGLIRAGTLADADIEAGRAALLTAASDPVQRATSAASHAALGLPDPAATDWATVAAARARAALADSALPDRLVGVLVHAEASTVEENLGPDVEGQDRFSSIPLPAEVFR